MQIHSNVFLWPVMKLSIFLRFNSCSFLRNNNSFHKTNFFCTIYLQVNLRKYKSCQFLLQNVKYSHFFYVKSMCHYFEFTSWRFIDSTLNTLFNRSSLAAVMPLLNIALFSLFFFYLVLDLWIFFRFYYLRRRSVFSVSIDFWSFVITFRSFLSSVVLFFTFSINDVLDFYLFYLLVLRKKMMFISSFPQLISILRQRSTAGK